MERENFRLSPPCSARAPTGDFQLSSDSPPLACRESFSPMNSRPQLRSRSHGFTLVELLTVIAIIAILMGLLFPAIGVVKEQARKAEAKTTCTAIVAAVKAYNTEYGKFPNPTGTTTAPTADVIVGGGTTTSNVSLFETLRARPSAVTLNPRKIVFFEGKDASNSDAPKSGFATKDVNSIKTGAFVDPWGTEYGVAIDFDYDNQLGTLPYADFKDTKAPQNGCGAFSLGKDGALGTKGDKLYKSTSGTPSDDVISWQ